VTPEQEAALRRDMGLDRPLLERFAVFLGNALQGDFGRSFFHRRPVGEVIAERLPATIELSLVALLIALLTAIPLGVLAAVRKNTILDRIATVGSLLGVSMPGFWFGILLIMLFAVQLQVLPVSGRIGYAAEVPAITHLLLVDTLLAGRLDSFVDALAHILLPAITLALPMAAILMRVTRSSMLEVLRADYMRTARAKGLRERSVVMRHGLRNAMLPVITVIGFDFGTAIGVAVLTETTFSWPGLGSTIAESVLERDLPVLLGLVLVVVLTYAVINLLVDLSYAWFDPRIRYGKGAEP
jgi:ABC-type dipeptide/oligopeptide/nickel transport system permease component